jgi:hypothetical protein
MPHTEDFQRKDYYELLGLKRSASLPEIKEAYREIARIYHPDSHYYNEIIDYRLTERDNEIFQLVTAAYHTLIKQETRQEYDRTLPPEINSWEEPSAEPSPRILQNTRPWNAPSSKEEIDLLRSQRMSQRLNTVPPDPAAAERPRTSQVGKAPYCHFGRESRYVETVAEDYLRGIRRKFFVLGVAVVGLLAAFAVLVAVI